MKSAIRFAFLLALPVWFTGCASVFNSGKEAVQIDSTPNGARVTVYDELGEVVASGRTQFKVELSAGKNFRRKSYRVKVEKLGYQPKEFLLENKLSGWYWGNLLYSGPLGALVVDPLTGNMWRLDPAQVEVKLEKIELPASERPNPVTSFLILPPDQLPPEALAARQPI